MMEAGDALTKGAQIAVAFAGLAAVVFVRRGVAVHLWPKADKFRLKLLLTTSLLPLILCLLGLLLLGVGMPDAGVWRWCSAIAASALIFGSLVYAWIFIHISRQDLEQVEASKRVYWTFSAIGFFLALLLIYNAVMLGRFWPFFTFIVLSLLVSIVQFLRLILTRSVQLQ